MNVNIAKGHKINGVHCYWLSTLRDTHFSKQTVNNHNILTTKKDYYFSHKDGKIHYTHMSCDNASYDFMVEIYSECLPGIYFSCGVATPNNLTKRLERAAKVGKSIMADDTMQEELRKHIKEID